jgi:hypothetical protein
VAVELALAGECFLADFALHAVQSGTCKGACVCVCVVLLISEPVRVAPGPAQRAQRVAVGHAHDLLSRGVVATA